MTAVVRPRHLVHRGSILASGFVFDVRLVPEQAARARILRIAAAVMDVHRARDLLIVRLRRPALIDCATAIGEPLASYGRLHASAPLAPDERSSLDTGTDAILLVRAGAFTILPLEAAMREDIAQWLDVSSFVVDGGAVSLGEIAAAPTAQWVAASEDVRATLGVAPLAAAGQALLAAVTSGPPAPVAAAQVRARPAPRALGALWRALARLLPRRAPAGDAQGEIAPPRDPRWFDRVRAWLARAAVRLLARTKLGRLVQRGHAQYLQRLLDMLDAHDLEDALRHAIPLGSGVEGALKTRPALTSPSPRAALTISPARVAASTSIELGDDLFGTLRQKYRRAFERLAAGGDIEKAAFVLAELLQADEEAVSFLERHHRWKLAAEIAEARKLPPGLVVRQWLLAGNAQRAIGVARRTGAFADAVARLESSHPEQARALRLTWADMLANGGAYAAAVDAIWPIEAARALAGTWIEHAIAVGGATGAKMLVRKLHIAPEAFAEVRDRFASLLSVDEDVPALAHAAGAEILSRAPTAETRLLAKMMARALLQHRGNLHQDPFLRRLVENAADPVFTADVRPGGTTPIATAGAVRVKASALAHVGDKREHNEDVCLATSLAHPAPARNEMALDVDVGKQGIALGVFDASGGRSSGEIASKLAASIVTKDLHGWFARQRVDGDDPASRLASAVEAASRAIYRRASEPAHRGMGSTATVATIHGSTLVVAHVGDTRGYLLRQGELVQITKDHTLLNEYIAMGKLVTDDEIEAFPHMNVLVRALGMKEEIDVDTASIALFRGDVVLLCSDGLWGCVDATVIRSALASSPQGACEALLKAALDAGGPDNVSIVVAQITGPGLRLPHDEPVDGALAGAPDPLRATARDAAWHKAQITVHRPPADAGALAVHDAAELPDGRMLVALGEIGAWLLSRDGKVLTRFAEPAHQLVISDHGDRAILAAHRGEVARLARLDLLQRKVRPWCDTDCHQWADSFDGSTWYVAHRDTLFAIDALDTDWRHHWDVREAGFYVGPIARSGQQVSANFSSNMKGGPGEIWTFELPSHTLRQRKSPSSPIANRRHASLSPGGRKVGWSKDDGPDWNGYLFDGKNIVQVTTARQPSSTCASDEWAALSQWVDGGLLIHLCDRSGIERATFRFDGAHGGAMPFRHMRFQDNRVLVFDPWGRVLVFCLRTGRILRELRVS